MNKNLQKDCEVLCNEEKEVQKEDIIFNYEEVIEFDELEAQQATNCACMCGYHTGGGGGSA